MTAGTQTDSDFAFAGLATPEVQATEAIESRAAGPDPLGALAGLLGTWKGHGFNAIWRPHHPADQQDRFLELNMTNETLVFTRINGPIPNRGLAMADINMFGLTYMQQISEASTGAGLHIEPGIWAAVPQTTDPSEPASVVRMASIPHGTVIQAQGVAQVLQGGPQNIPNNNILPFFFGNPAPANGDFNSVAQTFTELNLSQATQFRSVAPGVTQAIVQNPNSVLQAALKSSLQGTTMKSRTFLNVSTTNSILKAGGGTSNTAFLSSSTNPSGGNAKATQAQATFWIETIAGTGGQPDKHQLQYTQLVMLDFNGIHWPHVTVGTLVKQ
jgi:hypothetical protein